MFKRASMSVSSLVLATLCLSACGDDDGGGAKAGKPVDNPQVTQSASNLGSTSTEMASISTEPAAGQATINQVGTSIYAFAGAHQSFKAQAAAGAGLTAALTQAQVDENNGTYSYENGRLQASFTYSGASGGGISSDVRYEVDLTITEAEGGQTIAGDFSLDLEIVQPQFNLSYLIEATYDDLTLDSAGCPVGGGITVNYDIELGGSQFDSLPPQARDQFANAYKGGVVAATYGPNCGDVAVAGN